jgi:predicted SprT family Zn-dependent metalloprotease
LENEKRKEIVRIEISDQKKINGLLAEVAEEARAIGIPLSKQIDQKVLINRRARKRLGCCRMKSGAFLIEISAVVLEGGSGAVKEILAHELLHTCVGCQNHSALWKSYSLLMNQAYGYRIKRTISPSILGLPEPVMENKPARYVISCRSCGAVFLRQRKSPLVTRTHRYRCRCGGVLVQERVKESCRK